MSSTGSVKKVCLAYSGGLDTSVILRWLIEEYGCEVVAYCADVGQEDELDGLPEKARESGAVDCVIRDLREEFARDYVNFAFRAAAVYEGTYLLGTALARPVIAKAQVEVARATGCDAVAHGATGKGNDQVRFELTYIAADNQEHRPVMVHRALFGSMERLVGILIEHFAGAFPLWLSPTQATRMDSSTTSCLSSRARRSRPGSGTKVG